MKDVRLSGTIGLVLTFVFGLFAAPTAAVDSEKSQKWIDDQRAAKHLPDPRSAKAKTADQMQAYTQPVAGTDVFIHMVPIQGGEFLMGSPDNEPDRSEDEGPQHRVRIDPFWMGKFEVTWDEYELWVYDHDYKYRKKEYRLTERDKKADAVTRPTAPYTDMTFGMGHDYFPAISMTHLAAQMYCKWLSEKTGHYYRLPTEAEWEYAARAGTKTAYSFGDDAKDLPQHGWPYDDDHEAYRQVGRLKPNPWGLYDMHGNVAEWCLDQYIPDFYQKFEGKLADNPLAVATELYPRVVRGGSWDDEPDRLRSAARGYSEDYWKIQDPQLPQSVWYHTDAPFVGFRVVRPLRVPTAEERKKLRLDPVLPDDARITIRPKE